MTNRENSATFMQRSVEPGIHTTRIVHSGWRELFLSATPQGGETPADVFTRLAKVVRGHGAQVVAQDVFGLAAGDGAGLQALRDAFGEITWPLTWIEASGVLGGSQLWAVAGMEVRPVRVGDKVVGTVFEDEHVRYCRLGGLTPHDNASSREAVTGRVLEQMIAGLTAAQMGFEHVARTWFFLDDILAWYGRFNEVRTRFFAEQGIAQGVLPASTGIGFNLPVPLVAGLLAVSGKEGAPVAIAVPSPLQGEASEYGSSFSRAVELNLADHRRLIASGTASVAPKGQTVHVGELAGQIELTMQVVSALLAGRGFDFSHVVRALVYLRPGSPPATFERYLAQAGLANLPVVVTEAMICRDDLLFEIELDAVRPDTASGAD